MKLIICVLSITLAGILLFSTVSSNGQEELKKEPWKGTLKDGTEISRDNLSKMLKDHKKRFVPKGKKGQYLDLRDADLSEADLSGTFLRGAMLRRADLSKADLNGANMYGTYLSGANLSGANLHGVNLSMAILSKADLNGANLSGADLSKSHLSEADLRGANMSGVNLSWVILSEADLSEADLRKARLGGADLSEADLRGANLSDASMYGTDLSWADLRRANLGGANLSKTALIDTNLKDAILSGVNLTGSQYEPNSSPHKGFLGGIKGLSKVWFDKEKQSSLVQLRAALKESGLRNLEREATYAIEHWKAHWEPWYKKGVKYVLFESTCGYGLNYLRPLLILFVFIFLFSVPYMISLSKQQDEGIWMEWASKRMKEKKDEEEPFRLQPQLGYEMVLYGLYFSLLSAFHIGWKDLNVGSWIARIQPREYTLKATGWVRVVSGVQSLISIYLLALWVLTQFGRPFD